MNSSPNQAGNGSSRRERRHFSAEQKVQIVKQHLVDAVPVSYLCDQHEILPTQFYQWQKQLFEGAPPPLVAQANRPVPRRSSGSSSRSKPAWSTATR